MFWNHHEAGLKAAEVLVGFTRNSWTFPEQIVKFCATFF